jgi:hypothetical protein
MSMEDDRQYQALAPAESRPPAQPSGTLPATAEPFGRAIIVP